MATHIDRLVTVIGGSGFLGRHIVRALARRGWRIRVAVRRPDLANFLQPLGGVGQINAVQANLRYPASVRAAVEGAVAVVNVAGIAAEKGRQSFEAVYSFGARIAAEAAAAAGVSAYVQVSGLGADPKAPSLKAKAAARGLAALREALPQASIMLPSVVFGPEDSFLNTIAALARRTPVMPVFSGGTKLQPVYVGDVAEAVARALEGDAKAGAAYELGGPEVVTMEEIVRYVCDETHRRRAFAAVPQALGRPVGWICEVADTLSLGLLPREILVTRDQLALLGADNLVSPAAVAEGRTLEGLGIRPQPIAALAGEWLVRFRKTGQFDQRRAA